MGKSFVSTPAKFLLEKSYSFKLSPNETSKPCLGRVLGSLHKSRAPLSGSVGLGQPRQPCLPRALGSWDFCLEAGWLCCERRWQPALDGGTERGHTLSLDTTQGLQKGRSLQVLPQRGSWLPGSRQGCWHPTEPQVELPNSQLHSQDLGGLRQAPVILSTQEDWKVGQLQLLNVSRKGRKKICSKKVF